MFYADPNNIYGWLTTWRPKSSPIILFILCWKLNVKNCAAIQSNTMQLLVRLPMVNELAYLLSLLHAFIIKLLS